MHLPLLVAAALLHGELSPEEVHYAVQVTVYADEVRLRCTVEMHPDRFASEAESLGVDVDASDPGAMLRAYSAAAAPQVAENIVVTVEDEEAAHKLVSQDVIGGHHLGVEWKFAVPLDGFPRGRSLLLKVADANFALDPGQFRLALSVKEGVQLIESDVPEVVARATAVDKSSLTDEMRLEIHEAIAVIKIAGDEDAEAGRYVYPLATLTALCLVVAAGAWQFGRSF